MWSIKTKIVSLVFSVLLFLILLYVINYSVDVRPQVLQLFISVSLPMVGGLITLSFCSLLGSFSDTEDSAISHLLKWISEDSARNFFIGFLVTAYLNLIRPPLVANVPFLPYMEWVTIAVAVYVMYSVTRFSTEEFYFSSEGSDWKRHVQDANREVGRDLIRVTSVMEQFVDYGVKEPLLVYLALYLQRLGETEEGILKTLSPLIDYQKSTGRLKLHLLVFPWMRRKSAMRNKEDRETLLINLLDKIGGMQLE